MISVSNFSDDFIHFKIKSIFEDMNDSLYPLNNFYAHHLRKKDFSFLKDFAAQNPSSSLTFNFYLSQCLQLDPSDINAAEEFVSMNSFSEEYPTYLYVGSKTSLKNKYYSDFLPSAFNHLYNHYISNNIIKVVGPGQGSYILFDSSNIMNLPASLSEDSFQDTVSSFMASYNSMKSDNQYLTDVIQSQQQTIADLNILIEELKNENYITSQITWR